MDSQAIRVCLLDDYFVNDSAWNQRIWSLCSLCRVLRFEDFINIAFTLNWLTEVLKTTYNLRKTVWYFVSIHGFQVTVCNYVRSYVALRIASNIALTLHWLTEVLKTKYNLRKTVYYFVSIVHGFVSMCNYVQVSLIFDCSYEVLSFFVKICWSCLLFTCEPCIKKQARWTVLWILILILSFSFYLYLFSILLTRANSTAIGKITIGKKVQWDGINS